MIYRKVIKEAKKERQIDSFYQLKIKTKHMESDKQRNW
jgi:hypothetical protein